MRTALFPLILMMLMGGCCAMVDCDSDIHVSFNLIDRDTGTDLVFEQGISPDEIAVTWVGQVDPLKITRDDEAGRLWFSCNQPNPSLKLTYDGQEVWFQLIVYTDDTDCCPAHKIVGILTTANVELIDSNSIIIGI